MLILISPAKTLDFETPAITSVSTQPDFLSESQYLIKILRKVSSAELSSLMKISDKLAALNAERYANWSQPFTSENAKQAVLAFKGDVYTGLDAETLSQQQLKFAQNHLRILSGLYGLLRPLDLMQPYRLEMGTKLQNRAGNNLYKFWTQVITDKINEEAKGAPVINLASDEYSKVVNFNQLDSQVISPVFKDFKNGQYKIISFYAKKARGMMSRYMIENSIKRCEDVTGFNVGGYRYSRKMSTSEAPVFIRDEA